MKKKGLWIAGLLFAFFVTVLLLVRFMDGGIETSNRIILGYDKSKNRFEIFENKKNSYDGPYIIGNTLYEVNDENKWVPRNFNKEQPITVKVKNEDKDQFSFRLKNSLQPNPTIYEMPEKLIAISDIEGNFNAFSGFLIKHGVINEQFDWTYGKGHLVLPGDFVDRGEEVTQVLWLIYKLEDEAEAAGGKVHYLLGNHEILNFQGNASHNEDKYKEAAKLISKKKNVKEAVSFMYSEATELGKWMRTKNVVEKIGDIIFTHGGLSPALLNYQVTLPEINEIARNNWDESPVMYTRNADIEEMITGDQGPLWYRGLVKETKEDDKIGKKDLDKLLAMFDAQRIVVGHTVVKYIQSNYKGKVIAIDVRHGKEKYSGKTEGIYVENNTVYVVDGKGSKTQL